MLTQYAGVPATFSLKGWLLILRGDRSVIAMQEVRLGERAHRRGLCTAQVEGTGGEPWLPQLHT